MSYLREFYVQVSQATGWRFNMSARSTLQSNRSSRSQTKRFRNLVALLFLISAVPGLLVGQTETVDVSGNWLMSADLFGTTVYLRMELKQTGASVTGQYTGDKITSGEVRASILHLSATSDDGTTSDVEASLSGSTLAGTAVETDPKDKDHPTKYTFKATRVMPAEHRTPQRHEFMPSVFYRQFSPTNRPVLTVAPGDTV